MQNGKLLKKILRAPRTVFTASDIAKLWGEPHPGRLAARLHYLVRSGGLIRVRRGVFAKDDSFDRQEMATCIFRPSYVSFETVLLREGHILLESPSIHVASYLSREIEYGGRSIRYHKVRSNLLRTTFGLDWTASYPRAGAERAFLDTLRRDRNFRFSTVSGLEWEHVFEQLRWYRNRRLQKQVTAVWEWQEGGIQLRPGAKLPPKPPICGGLARWHDEPPIRPRPIRWAVTERDLDEEELELLRRRENRGPDP